MALYPNKLRFFLRFSWALLRKYYAAIFLGLGLGALSFLWAPQAIRLIPPIRNTNTIAVVGRFDASQLPLYIQQKISLGLTAVDADNQVVPGLAENWQATDSGKTYLFTLASHLKWQDGSEIKSTDIKYNFKDAAVTYPDSTHIKVVLTDPFSALPAVLSRPVFKHDLLGMGSYRLQYIKYNGSFVDHLVLAPVDNFSHLPLLRYNFYASEQIARTAYKLGEVDSINDLQDLGELKNWPNTEIVKNVHNERYVAVFFNNQTTTRELRQALSYAIDKSRWPNRATGPENPDSWVYNPEVKTYDYDADRAKQLQANESKPLKEITLSTVPSYLSVANSIQSDWQSLGIKVDISVIPDIPSDFTALILAQSIPIDPDQYYFWHSTQSTNLTQLKNARIDKLLEDGRTELDPTKRKSIYQDFQKFLLDEAPAAFLFHPQSYFISRT